MIVTDDESQVTPYSGCQLDSSQSNSQLHAQAIEILILPKKEICWLLCVSHKYFLHNHQWHLISSEILSNLHACVWCRHQGERPCPL